MALLDRNVMFSVVLLVGSYITATMHMVQVPGGSIEQAMFQGRCFAYLCMDLSLDVSWGCRLDVDTG